MRNLLNYFIIYIFINIFVFVLFFGSGGNNGKKVYNSRK